MAYIGQPPSELVSVSPAVITFTGDGSTTAFTLARTVTNDASLEVFVDNVQQQPTAAYTAAGTTLTFLEAPASGASIYVIHRDYSVAPLFNLADSSVTTAKIVNGAVTIAKISGLGTVATQNASNIAITGGTISGITTLGGNTTVASNVDFDFNGTVAQNIVAVSASSIDCSVGNYFTKTVSTTTTFTFDNVPASRRYGFILRLTNGGSSTVNWPASVVWPAGVAPTLTSSGVDMLIFITDNGGTTWRASSLVNYAS